MLEPLNEIVKEELRKNEQAAQDEPQIILNSMDVYADAITKFRNKIGEAVKQGIMSEQTGIRIITDQEYGFFQQIVTIEYK